MTNSGLAVADDHIFGGSIKQEPHSHGDGLSAQPGRPNARTWPQQHFGGLPEDLVSSPDIHPNMYSHDNQYHTMRIPYQASQDPYP